MKIPVEQVRTQESTQYFVYRNFPPYEVCSYLKKFTIPLHLWGCEENEGGDVGFGMPYKASKGMCMMIAYFFAFFVIMIIVTS